MFVWSDEKATVFTQWAEGEPSTMTEPACVCIDAQRGNWYTKSCTDSVVKDVICKISNGWYLLHNVYKIVDLSAQDLFATFVTIDIHLYPTHFVLFFEDTVPTLPSSQTVKCHSSDWILYGEDCYLITTTKLNQTQAQEECRIFPGGELVSIHSSYENLILTAYIQAYGSSWIGLIKDEKGI